MSRVAKKPAYKIPLERAAIFREVGALAPSWSDRIAVLNSAGTIISVNESWLNRSRNSDPVWAHLRPGANYLEACRRASQFSTYAHEALIGIRSVINAQAREFRMDYTARTRTGQAYCRMTAIPFHYGEATIAIVHTDITELKRSKEELSDRLHAVAQKLLDAQENEWQRISQVISDDLGSRLNVIMSDLRQIMVEQAAFPVIDDLRRLLAQTMDFYTAMRNISHNLDPSTLRFEGIGGVLKSLVKEFARRPEVKIEVVVPGDTTSLPPDVGLCVFRVAQECLLNIAKHSGARSARVILQCNPNTVQLRVLDTGRGFIPAGGMHNGGLGLISMKERVRHLKGRLAIDSRPGSGTRVHLTIPISQNRSVAQYTPDN